MKTVRQRLRNLEDEVFGFTLKFAASIDYPGLKDRIRSLENRANDLEYQIEELREHLKLQRVFVPSTEERWELREKE